MINVFPNPANDQVNISMPYKLKNSSIQIYNIEGRLVKNKSLSSVNNLVDCSKMKKGVYIYKIKNDETILTIDKLFIY